MEKDFLGPMSSGVNFDSRFFVSVIFLSPLISDMRGTVRNVTFSKCRGVNVAKKKAVSNLTPTEKQYRQRWAMRALVIWWRTFTPEFRDAYRFFCRDKSIPAYQHFIGHAIDYYAKWGHWWMTPQHGNMPKPWADWAMNDSFSYLPVWNPHNLMIWPQFDPRGVLLWLGDEPYPDGTKFSIMGFHWPTDMPVFCHNYEMPLPEDGFISIPEITDDQPLYLILWNYKMGWMSGGLAC
jgi:hypothetical protein